MKLSRPIVFVILLALFLGALATRHATTGRLDSPYFRGSAAMEYRAATNVADGVPLTARDVKAGHPEGFVPARVRASGVEYFSGQAFRVARFFGETDGRVFARRFTMFCAALCVFAAYALARGLWDCRAAGLLAAFLVTFLAPLVGATNGRVFSHTVFAALLGSLHAAIAVRALARRSLMWSIAAALCALALLASWEPASILVLAWIVPVAWSQSMSRRARSAFVVAHVAGLLLACAVFPHLVATRALGSWSTAVAIACAGVAFLPEARRRSWRPVPFTIAGAAVITALATPWRAGATEQFPAAAYVMERLRFLAGRPESPGALSDWMRSLWSFDHAPTAAHPLLLMFLPLGFLAIATALCRSCRERRAHFVAGAVVAGVAAFALIVDRSALPVAALAMIAFAAGGVRGLRSGWQGWSGPWARTVLVAVGAFVAFASVVLRGSVVDVPTQIAKAAGVAYRDKGAFLWVSLENTDRELVRFVATRTSVSESILAPDGVSAVLLAFSGRSIAQLPGATSKAASERHVALTRALYASEDSLYALCTRIKAGYVLYTIDTLLDSSRYSPRYLAGLATIDRASIAFRMHFQPESIQHFTLLYENDHYRLFKVTAGAEPIFLTDHPPFFQRELLARTDGDLDAFRESVVQLMLTCADGVNARVSGNAAGARARLEWCVGQAPHFTHARMALADALMDLGDYAAARTQVGEVIAYAPDNTLALYYAAYLEVQLDHPEAAKPYLTLIFAQEHDATMLAKAKTLQNYIERKLPIKPARPQEP